MSQEIESHLPVVDGKGGMIPVWKVWRERALRAEELATNLELQLQRTIDEVAAQGKLWKRIADKFASDNAKLHARRDKWRKLAEEGDTLRNLCEEYKKMWNEESKKVDELRELRDGHRGVITRLIKKVESHVAQYAMLHAGYKKSEMAGNRLREQLAGAEEDYKKLCRGGAEKYVAEIVELKQYLCRHHTTLSSVNYNCTLCGMMLKKEEKDL